MIEKTLISPTGKPIRNDAAGYGHYHASRGNRLHQGMDFLCAPGQEIYCPIQKARLVRTAYPYADQEYGGVLLQNPYFEIFLFYFLPTDRIHDNPLNQGDVIGVAQDITQRYNHPKMQPHIHLEIKSADPRMFIGE